jgi:hypothetical protein
VGNRSGRGGGYAWRAESASMIPDVKLKFRRAHCATCGGEKIFRGIKCTSCGYFLRDENNRVLLHKDLDVGNYGTNLHKKNFTKSITNERVAYYQRKAEESRKKFEGSK